MSVFYVCGTIDSLMLWLLFLSLSLSHVIPCDGNEYVCQTGRQRSQENKITFVSWCWLSSFFKFTNEWTHMSELSHMCIQILFFPALLFFVSYSLNRLLVFLVNRYLITMNQMKKSSLRIANSHIAYKAKKEWFYMNQNNTWMACKPLMFTWSHMLIVCFILVSLHIVLIWFCCCCCCRRRPALVSFALLLCT